MLRAPSRTRSWTACSTRPAYTRPATFRDLTVPDVLLSGNHARIAAWHDAQRLDKTRTRRPDLLGDDDA